jgi:primary-amine oxidase
MTRSPVLFIVISLACICVCQATEIGRAPGAPSPHDGLSIAEYETVAAVLESSGKLADDRRYATVNLAEPDKPEALAWRPGDAVKRRAFVAIRQERELYEGIVDLGERKLVSWEKIDGAQPALLDSEFMLAQIIVRKDEAWVEAIKKRGIDNVKTVFCFPAFPGNFGLPRDEKNDRLGMVSCYDTGSEHGLWGRPIAGLMAIVDFDERKVVELIDEGVVPIPAGGPGVNAKQPNTMPATGPTDRRFTIAGHWIEWDKWRFHLRIDPRVGPVISRASIRDGDRRRSVLYQGSVSELFVPYMDPTRNWYFRTYLDVGEYGIGSSGVPLRLGIDCPADGALVDTAFMNDMGKIYPKEGIACVFERETGDAGWSHYKIVQGGSVLRRHTELVVRFIVWLGNYDYVLDWVFTETGSLKGRVGATGIVQVRGVNSNTMSDRTADQDTAYGRLIAPGTVAIHHDHFFGFRLDLDVDGTKNQLSIDRLRKVELDGSEVNTPRRQIWQVFPEIPTREADARLNVNLQNPALWRVVNPAATNRVGNPVSYQLLPGVTARTLLDGGEIAHRRAAFTDYHLWVTPYQSDERYMAGDYPNRHPGDAGLPEWTAANRPIKNTDIVLWYTIGMHHVVRAEDWPIMPRISNEFELRPFDFFD